VRGLNREKFLPFVFFHWANDLVQQFEKLGCRVIIRTDFSVGALKNKYGSILSHFGQHRSVRRLSQRIFSAVAWLSIACFKYPSILRDNKISLVHINNSFKVDLSWMLVPKILRVKCVCHQRGFVETSLKIGSFRRWVINHWIDKVVCISEAVRKDCQKHGVFNCVVIHNGLDADNFAGKVLGTDIRRQFRLSEATYPILGIVGNIKHWKGQHVVIDAVARLRGNFPAIRLLIVGAPPDKEKSYQYFLELRRRVENLQLQENVIFTGYRSDIPDIIDNLDILVHSSVTPEPFGRVILEGMALKKPVIATAHGGPLEIINSGESGILVPPNDIQAMADAIKFLAEDKYAAHRIGESGHNFLVEFFNSKINVDKTENVYLSLF